MVGQVDIAYPSNRHLLRPILHLISEGRNGTLGIIGKRPNSETIFDSHDEKGMIKPQIQINAEDIGSWGDVFKKNQVETELPMILRYLEHVYWLQGTDFQIIHL